MNAKMLIIKIICGGILIAKDDRTREQAFYGALVHVNLCINRMYKFVQHDEKRETEEEKRKYSLHYIWKCAIINVIKCT